MHDGGSFWVLPCSSVEGVMRVDAGKLRAGVLDSPPAATVRLDRVVDEPFD